MEKGQTYVLNRVDGFNPFDYIETGLDKRGNEIIRKTGIPYKYLNTKAKETWLKLVYPKSITKAWVEKIPLNENFTHLVATAEVYYEPGQLAASWQKQYTCWDLADEDDMFSAVQTIALSHALSKAGFGCEIELALGLGFEGELPDKEEEPAEKPKKLPKKEEKEEETKASEENFEEEVDKLVEEVETLNENPKEDTASKIAELLEMKLALTSDPAVKPAINIKMMVDEGMTLGDVLSEHKDFGALVKKRPNIKKSLSKECIDALIFIEDNKM